MCEHVHGMEALEKCVSRLIIRNVWAEVKLGISTLVCVSRYVQGISALKVCEQAMT